MMEMRVRHKLNSRRSPEVDEACTLAVARIQESVKNREKVLLYGRGDRPGICGISILILLLRYFNADFDYFLLPKGGSREGLIRDMETHMCFFSPDLIISLDEPFTDNVYDTVQQEQTDMISIGHGYDRGPYVYDSKAQERISDIFDFSRELSVNFDTRNVYRYADLLYLGSNCTTHEGDEMLSLGFERVKRSRNYGIMALKALGVVEALPMRRLLEPVDNPASMVDNARIIIELLTTEDHNRAQQIAKYLMNSN